MELPIYTYGNDILATDSIEIPADFDNLNALVESMWQTMYNAKGCGLAASQVGHALQLFVVDSHILYSNLPDKERAKIFSNTDTGCKETFINARIIAKSDDVWYYKESCLSIPGITKSVLRPWSITIDYFNLEFELQTKTFYGMTARIIQHEYDHTRGVLFTERLNALASILIKRKLNKIKQGFVKTPYNVNP